MGLFWGLVFGLSNGSMYSSVTIAQSSTGVNSQEIMLIRSITTLVIAYISGKLSGIDFGISAHMKIPKQLWISLIKRGVFGISAIISSYLSIQYMPVSIAVSIMQASAFVTSIFAFFMRNEKLGILEVLIIVFGLIGCLMIANT